MRAHLPMIAVAPALALGGFVGGVLLVASGQVWYGLAHGRRLPFGGDSGFLPFALVDAAAVLLTILLTAVGAGLVASCHGLMSRRRGARWPLAILLVLVSGGASDPAWLGPAIFGAGALASLAMFIGPGARWFGEARPGAR